MDGGIVKMTTLPNTYIHHTKPNQYKKEYEVRLSGFPKNSIVALQALRIEEGDAEGEEDEDVTTRSMATVSTDGDGAASVRCLGGFGGGLARREGRGLIRFPAHLSHEQLKWRFFALGFPEGDYEVKVRTHI